VEADPLPSLFDNIKGDIFGGTTAAVVALPLALAFGVASGVGAIAGLYGAIAVGFFAAVFGGTKSQVSGPTGPMTVVMAVIVTQHAENLGEAFAIVILGGFLQIIFGLVRVGRFVTYTPYSVVSGFMSGIGVIIIIIQTLPFIGMPAEPGGPLGVINVWAGSTLQVNTDALMIAGLCLAVVIFWPNRLHAVLPPHLASLVAGSATAFFFLSDAPVIGEIPTGLPDLHLPLVSPANLPAILGPAFVLALLGSIDSLLTSLVADSITRTRHKSDRELIGQGIGNMVSGLIGGLPGAGATMRTVVNVRAGGRSPLSGALHALILLALVLGLGPLAEQVPHAALAGILIKVGWDIIDWNYIKRFRRAPRDQVLVMFITLGLTVFVDLVTAVAVGFILAGFATARWMEREEMKGVTAIAYPDKSDNLDPEAREALEKLQGRVAVVSLRGHFSYASARKLNRWVGQVSMGYEAIIYDFTEAAHIDTSAALAVEELLTIAVNDNIFCFIAGLSDSAGATVKSLGVLDAIPPGHITATLLDSIKMAESNLADRL